MYPFLLDDTSEHKKAKCVNENIVATIINSEYKDVLFNKKCLSHSIDRAQTKDYRIGAYEIKKISSPSFDDIIHIQHNGWVSSWLSESVK